MKAKVVFILFLFSLVVAIVGVIPLFFPDLNNLRRAFFGGVYFMAGIWGCMITGRWLYKNYRKEKEKRSTLYLATHPRPITPQ